MINLQKIFCRTMVSTKGKELLPHHEFPVRRFWCYVPPCATIIPLHVLNEVCIIIIQEKGSANFMPSVGPLLNMDSMFCLPLLLPFTLEGYFVNVSRHIHDKWNWLLHPKLTEDPLGMMPLHYPKVEMAPLPSKYAARQCNTQAGSPMYTCTVPIQFA